MEEGAGAERVEGNGGEEYLDDQESEKEKKEKRRRRERKMEKKKKRKKKVNFLRNERGRKSCDWSKNYY